MDIDKYPLIVGETSMVFEFLSEGINGAIEKIIIYRETNLHNVYNLGFGDKNYETGSIDNLTITNNGDSQKVLATVASSVLIFTEKYPEAIVYATGSSKSRTRLYRIGITNNLETVGAEFHIYGELFGTWEPFRKGVEYEAFI